MQVAPLMAGGILYASTGATTVEALVLARMTMSPALIARDSFAVKALTLWIVDRSTTIEPTYWVEPNGRVIAGVQASRERETGERVSG